MIRWYDDKPPSRWDSALAFACLLLTWAVFYGLLMVTP